MKIYNMIKSVKPAVTEKNSITDNVLPNLSRQEKRVMDKYLHTREFKAEEIFYNQNSPSVALYYIQNGSVGIFVQIEEEREERIQYLSAGRWFGLSALFSDGPRPQTAKALESTTIACLLKSDIESLQIAYPQLYCKLLFTLCQDVNANLNEVSFEYSVLLAKLAKSNILV